MNTPRPSQRSFVLLTTIGIFLAALVWFTVGSAQKRALQFIGLGSENIKTRAANEAAVLTFRRMGPGYAAAVQQWLDGGTNVGLFQVTNYSRSAVDIFPSCRLFFKDEPGKVELLPLLNSPTGSGIFLTPGQTATVEVPLLVHSGEWRVQLVYHKRGAVSIFRLLRLPGGEPGHALRSSWLKSWQGTSSSKWADYQ